MIQKKPPSHISFFGFSLLELLIVLAIIVVLSVIAYPVYNHHLVRAKRNQAQVNLMHLASQLESFYTINNTYQGATLDSLGVKTYTDDQSYQIKIAQISDNTYYIQAIPLGAQAQLDHACSTLGLNELGERTVSGMGTVAQCW